MQRVISCARIVKIKRGVLVLNQHINLLKGNIEQALGKLALPIMATSFIQMAYNMIDMIWIGKVGSGAVAAVGAAGMYMWLSNGLSTLAKMGGQVQVGQSLGAKQYQDAKMYSKAAIQLGIVFALLFGGIAVFCANQMIAFFQLNEAKVIQDAVIYLQITCGLVIFNFINQILTGILTATGNSRSSFIATSIGLLINLVLDPVFIFGFGFIPAMGVAGAAVATVVAQFVVFILFLIIVKQEASLFSELELWKLAEKTHIIKIIKIGLPTSLQSMLFSGISMVIARMIAGWGDGAVAVQKVGSQIESISWMAAEGFAAAVNSFVAQNYGAKQYERVKLGYRKAMVIVGIWGMGCTLLLLLFPEFIFQIFISETKVKQMGIDYLRILAISEIFMCIEITTAGAFCGMGKTIPPSIVSISLTAARIPTAFLLSQSELGLNGVWWSISLSSALKGVVLVSWFLWYKKYHLYDHEVDKSKIEIELNNTR